jgi:hypothetical protein
VRVLKWFWGVIAGGVVWWLISVGGGIIVSALVASATEMRQPWVSLLAAGTFLISSGLLLGLLRLLVALLPRKARRALLPRRAPLFTLPDFLTNAGRITTLIEEGQSLAQIVPPPGQDQRSLLVQQLAGVNIDYPARVYEWEMRAWRTVSGPGLSQWRGLFPRPESAHPLAGLGEHVQERVRQLQTILARL